MRLSIERVSRQIADPATDTPFRKIMIEIGEVDVMQVDEKSAESKIISGQDFKVGDTAKSK
jgi:hypothetical protein